MTTVTINPGTVERKWWVIDARDAVLGRLSSTAARLLAGKHKKTYSPAHDHGDFVIIINAEKVAMTGNKRLEMRYFNHSQYAGGWRNLSVDQVEAKRPGYPVRHAILGMLPHNPRGRAMASKLFVYAGDKHPHAAQKPEAFELRKAS
ncbi:MAG TPA: 50S ribosomal protein L13 [Fibrobacteria bacterium]|jgi:large subunit ribosomal protein L13|nr:50S ribosomal protein L13 [Fibrobacteria bacterium]